MRFETFAEFKRAWPKEAALMEDPDASTFVKEMRQKVERRENLTPRMRSALSNIATEKELSKTLDVPGVNACVAFACEIVQMKQESDRPSREKWILEFRTRFGMRGRLQIDDGDYDSLIDLVTKNGMTDEDEKGSLWIEVQGTIVWKKETFVILNEIDGWEEWDRDNPPHSGHLRQIPKGGGGFRKIFPSDDDVTFDGAKLFDEHEEPPPVETRTKRRPRKAAKDRPKATTQTEKLQQDAEDVADDWEKALDF